MPNWLYISLTLGKFSLAVVGRGDISTALVRLFYLTGLRSVGALGACDWGWASTCFGLSWRTCRRMVALPLDPCRLCLSYWPAEDATLSLVFQRRASATVIVPMLQNGSEL
jgi:hypothetical protein